MGIPRGKDLTHPIVVMCKNNNKSKDEPRLWVDMAKVHLLNPAIAIESSSQRTKKTLRTTTQQTQLTHLATIAKVSDSMAKRYRHDVRQFSKRNLETCRIACTLLCDILEDSFLRKLDFQITQVPKIAHT
jgi:hypothetical protein